MALELSYLGSVNRWECDENDHLNVRFFADKMNQAARGWLAKVTGATPSAAGISTQHIRFLAEARIATPLRIDCGLLEQTGTHCVVLALMFHNLTEEPLAAFTSHFPGDFKLARAPITAPDWALPRGLDPSAPFVLPAGLWPAGAESAEGFKGVETLEALGFRTMGVGVISEAECSEGNLRPEHYIGRISDGMPNLWSFTGGEAATAARQAGMLGGAVLEYRLDVLAAPSPGDVFRHLSGIRSIGNKTQHMVHAIVNESRGELAARAEAIGVSMDLETRRAVVIDADRRRSLAGLMLRGS